MQKRHVSIFALERPIAKERKKQHLFLVGRVSLLHALLATSALALGSLLPDVPSLAPRVFLAPLVRWQTHFALSALACREY